MGESFLIALTITFPVLFFLGAIFTVWATGESPRDKLGHRKATQQSELPGL